ncbi:MAG: hypothetical protein IGR93_09785 [Hydrococcus sp. C42_A2020_068]|nr:hypothetical protein [Hydrococcus sp. C42_A2020_068]
MQFSHLIKNWLSAGIIAVTSLSLNPNLSAKAANCKALPVVDGEGTSVQKTVSPPAGASVIYRNNWNTDFAVEPTASYNRYVATIRAKEPGEYTIRMNLKYSDDTSGEVYNQTVSLKKGESISITGNPRRGVIPYQVNLYVGELNAVGKTYRASVVGCR